MRVRVTLEGVPRDPLAGVAFWRCLTAALARLPAGMRWRVEVD